MHICGEQWVNVIKLQCWWGLIASYLYHKGEKLLSLTWCVLVKETWLLTFKVTFCIHKEVTYMISDGQKVLPVLSMKGVLCSTGEWIFLCKFNTINNSVRYPLTLKFSSIWCGVTDLGITLTFLWIWSRISTCRNRLGITAEKFCLSSESQKPYVPTWNSSTDNQRWFTKETHYRKPFLIITWAHLITICLWSWDDSMGECWVRVEDWPGMLCAEVASVPIKAQSHW